MAATTIGNLISQLVRQKTANFETNSPDKWHLLRTFWNRYPETSREFILKVAGINGQPKPLECYEKGEKRQIAAAIRDCLAFADVDNALNGKDRKLWRSL